MEKLAHADEVVFLWINGLVGTFRPLDEAMEWIVSDYLVPAAMALTLLGLWFGGSASAARMRCQVGVLVALASMAIASGAVFALNGVYFRDRPFVDLDVSLLFYEPTDSSFPANSAAAMFGLAAAVWGIDRRLGAALTLMAALFSFSRVYAGVHYPLDIVAAAAIGFVAAGVTLKLRRLVEPLPTMVIKAARILCLA